MKSTSYASTHKGDLLCECSAHVRVDLSEGGRRPTSRFSPSTLAGGERRSSQAFKMQTQPLGRKAFPPPTPHPL